MGLLGKMISAAAGRTAARQIGGANAGPLGMVAGAVLPFVLRRFGPLGMIGVALGGYAIKRIAEAEGKREAKEAGAKPQGLDTSTSSLPKLPPL